MTRDLIRVMQALFLPGAPVCPAAPWQPNTDVSRTPDGWLVKFELAGVRPEDIELEVLGGHMKVSGTRRDEPAGERVYYQMEIAYSRFERHLELPVDLKRARITTAYRDGLLLVHVAPGRGEAHGEEGHR
jgi:HSP20 family protein